MALQLMSQAEFEKGLTARGFKKTNFSEGDVTLWEREGKFYSVPLPVHTENNHILYCPFALPLFFRHVFGDEAEAKTDSHGQKDYSVGAPNTLAFKEPKKKQ